MRTEFLCLNIRSDRPAPAPVLGNPQLAASRDLLVFAAADSQTLDRCMPLLEWLCRRVVVIGERAEQANRFQLVTDHLPAGAA